MSAATGRMVLAAQSACVSAALVLAGAVLADGAQPWPAEPRSTAQQIGTALVDFEPSGAAWDADAARLWVVDDGGDVAALELDGTVALRFDSLGLDLEAIAITADGDIYLGREQPPAIVALDRSSGSTGKSWILTEMEVGSASQRLEALTFLADGDAGGITSIDGGLYNEGAGSRFGAGGLFLAGHQGNGRVYVFDVDLDGGSGAHFVNFFGPFADGVQTLTDLAGLDYHHASGVLYAVWNDPFADAIARVGAISAATPYLLLDLWTASSGSNDEEGVALLDSEAGGGLSRIVIAEDQPTSHEVWVYDGFPLAQAPTTTTLPTEPLCGDANGDGSVTATDALMALATAAGLSACEPCVCDADSSGAVTASDALELLVFAVGRAVELSCTPCP